MVEVPGAEVERLAELPRLKHFKEDRRVWALLEDTANQVKADYAWSNAITGEGVTAVSYTHLRAHET